MDNTHSGQEKEVPGEGYILLQGDIRRERWNRGHEENIRSETLDKLGMVESGEMEGVKGRKEDEEVIVAIKWR